MHKTQELFSAPPSQEVSKADRYMDVTYKNNAGAIIEGSRWTAKNLN